MTKEEALHAFWSFFGVPAVMESSVPDSKNPLPFPYIAYEVATGDYDSGPVYLTGTIWDRNKDGYSASDAMNRKAQAISSIIGRNGLYFQYDGGTMRITRGSPFTNYGGDPSDEAVRRCTINIVVEFWSTD